MKKKILCRVTDIKPNFEVYGEDFFNNILMPKVGDEFTRELLPFHTFEAGSISGESTIPTGPFPLDKNGSECKHSMYYTWYEQISIIN